MTMTLIERVKEVMTDHKGPAHIDANCCHGS